MGLHYVNNMRGIAILMVIFAHALSTVKSDYLLYKVLDALTDNITLVFVAISGYLFTSLSENYKFSRFMSVKLKTVFLPYIVISIPAIIMYVGSFKEYHHWIDMQWFHSQLNAVEQAGLLLITGASLGPLWFIPMIFLFFLLSPVFIYLKKHDLLGSTFAITMLGALLFGRPQLNDNAFHSLVFFLPAYLAGMWLSTTDRWQKIPMYQHCLPVLGAYLIIAPLIHLSVDVSNSLDLLIKLFFTLLIFMVSAQYLNRKLKWLDLFARLSFFLFFVHGYMSGFFRVIYRLYFDTNGQIIYSLIAFCGILAACIVGFLITKPLLQSKSKFLIGA